MRITDLPELSAADLTEDDVVVVDHDTGNGIETKKITWQNLLNKIYPVGSLYMSAKATSPASLFGGTWEQIKDCFILAAGDTYTAGGTGGEAAHALTVAELASHTHHQRIGNTNGSNKSSARYITYSENINVTTWAEAVPSMETSFTGGGKAHNNMPPYLTVYVWKRTA